MKTKRKEPTPYKCGKFNVGNMVYCEFKLATVASINEVGNINSVNFDGIEMSGNIQDACFPVDEITADVSDRYDYEYNRIHRSAGNLNLNYPDIHRVFVCMWIQSIIVARKKPKQNWWANVSDFTNEVIGNIEQVRSLEMLDPTSDVNFRETIKLMRS